MLNKLSSRISDWICANAGIEGERKEVITYGIMASLHMIVYTAVIAAIGLITNTFLPIMTICWSAAFFRQQSGGAHAKNALLCTTIGCLVCFLLSLGCRCLAASFRIKTICIVLAVIVFGLAAYVIIKNVPVDSPNKPIKTEKKKRRMKRNSWIVIGIYALLFVLSMILGNEHSQWVLFALSMLVGIAWQTLMLTKVGYALAGEIQKPISALSERIFHS